MFTGRSENEFCIRSWNASIYDHSSRQWRYGVMKLFPKNKKILFCQDNKNKRSIDNNEKRGASIFEFELTFSDIRLIKKCLSSLIFPAIVIVTSKTDEYWFSSFDNREETFLFIEHFFLSTPVDKPAPSPQEDVAETHSTTMGKELLRSVVDSNKSLTAAGNQLIEQGQQLRNSSVKMIEINHDLDVASRFIKGLHSSIPRLRIPHSCDKKDGFFVSNENDILNICTVDALYCDVLPNVNLSLKKCEVTVEEKGLYVMDKYQKIIQSFEWALISRIQVFNLWEFCITQYLIGQPDRKGNIVSANVPCLLRELEYYRSEKIEYVTPDVEFAWSNYKQRKQQAFKGAIQNSEQHSLMSDEGDDNHDLHQASQTIPSAQEVVDLSKELTNLKSLALGVQQVQDEQLKDIDELTTAVTKGSDRISKLNKTMKRII